MAEIHNYDSECEELKPCPFCGGIPLWHLRGNDRTPSRTVVIKCQNCGAKMETSGIRFSAGHLATLAADKWNTRKNND